MITKLPDSRVAELPAIREKWLKIGLRTRTDRPLDAAWAGAKEAYRLAGRAEPKLHIWMESPLKGVIACGVLSQASAQVRAQVLVQVRDQVSAQVSDQVRAQVRAQASDQASDQVRDQVRDQVLSQVRAQVSAFANGIWWNPGGFDSWWLSFYESLREHCDFAKLSGLIQIAENCCCSWMFPDIVVFSASPTILHRDSRNRLHCENGQAIGWSDGFGLYRWHGVSVPEYVILRPEEITITAIQSERNAEVRRVMIERYGQARYLIDSGAREIHSDDYGTLYRKEIANDEPLVMVKVVNSTPEPDGTFKDYFLRVPPTIKRAREAVAWTFDVPEEEYAPLVET